MWMRLPSESREMVVELVEGVGEGLVLVWVP